MRLLDERFEHDLIVGLLHPIREFIKNDHTLILEIRENEIHVYYRGGKLFGIKVAADSYRYEGNSEYGKAVDNLLTAGDLYASSTWPNVPDIIDSSAAVDALIVNLPIMKQSMDFYYSNIKEAAEREFQQLVVRENNTSKIANGTDYFIIDIEYADTSIGAKPDLIALKWFSKPHKRKESGLVKHPPRLAFIEMKYGDDALGGSAGLLKHMKDIMQLLNDSNRLSMLKTELLGIFEQKRRLGLIESIVHNTNEIKRFSDEKPEFLLLLANHDPDSVKLLDVLKSLDANNAGELDLKIITANFMGYGLYDEGIVELKVFIKNYEKQIYSKNHI